MKEIVFADQAKIDMGQLDRATRLRVAAAIQRPALTNAGISRNSKASIRPSTGFALATGASASLFPTVTLSASTVSRIAKTPIADPHNCGGMFHLLWQGAPIYPSPSTPLLPLRPARWSRGLIPCGRFERVAARVGALPHLGRHGMEIARYFGFAHVDSSHRFHYGESFLLRRFGRAQTPWGLLEAASARAKHQT